MSNIRHILRLHTQKVGFFEIINQTGIPRTILRKHINDFETSGLSFEEINELTDKDLEELFLKPVEKPMDIRQQTLLNLFPSMEKELKRKGVTRKILWENYAKNHPDGYTYGRFLQLFSKWRSRPTLRSFQGGIEYSNYKGICSPAYIILRNKIEIEAAFYKYYFKTASYIKLLNKKLEGIRDGKMISYTYFSETSLPSPSLKEQARIANFISSMDKKIETEKNILERYERQKKYLLANLFI